MDKAIELFNKAIVIKKKTYGGDHPSLATSYNNLASVYKSQVRAHPRARAAPPQRGGVELVTAPKEAFDPAALAWNVPDNPSSQRPPTAQGELDEAIKLYKQALAIFKKVKGEASTEVATLMNNIAELYETQVCTPACGTPAPPPRRG